VPHPLELAARVGVSYTHTIPVLGAPTPKVVLGAGSTVPAGLNFDATFATISGTPEAGTAGRYHLVLQASNGVGSDKLDVYLTLTTSVLGGGESPTPSTTPTTTPTPTTTLAASPNSPVYAASPAGSGASLAGTGSDISPMVIAAAVSLLLGFSLLVARRFVGRRKES
jgi:hypothetical protein